MPLDSVVVLVGGPIASGKSTVARATARAFEQRGVSAAAIDLDLIYEMLGPREASKDDPKTWARARRCAAALTEALLADGVGAVVVEGDVLRDDERLEFVSALRSPSRTQSVTLRISFDVALDRVHRDPSRRLSRDPDFLARHYEELRETLAERPQTDVVIDTGVVGVDEAADAIVDSALSAASRH